jgi:hypothetical protein
MYIGINLPVKMGDPVFEDWGSSADGVRIETPQTPRGMGYGRCFLATGGGVWSRVVPLSVSHRGVQT